MVGAGAAEFPGLRATCWAISTSAIDGDTASSRTICFNPMVLGGDQNQILFCGLWYEDEFVRTPEGWRMNSRVETKCFDKVV